MTYSEKLKDPRWQKKRLEVFKRDKWKCCLCEDKETTLNVHHLSYSGEPWEADLSQLRTLCQDCHSMVSYFNVTPIKVMKDKQSESVWFSCLEITHEKPTISIIQYTNEKYSILGFSEYGWEKTKQEAKKLFNHGNILLKKYIQV